MLSLVEICPPVLEKIFQFCHYLTLEKDVAIHLNKFNTLHSFTPGCFCAKFGWNWPTGSGEEDFKNSSMYFRYFLIFSPLKGRGPSLEQSQMSMYFHYFVIPLEKGGPFIWANLNIPFVQGYFVPSLVEFDPVVLEKQMKIWKCLNLQTGDGQQSREAHLSFQLRWAYKPDRNLCVKHLWKWMDNTMWKWISQNNSYLNKGI